MARVYYIFNSVTENTNHCFVCTQKLQRHGEDIFEDKQIQTG
jgi:hypothetical protein